MKPSSGRPLAAAFLFGIFANLAQVALLRFLLGTFSGTEIHLGVFLAVWLTGVAAGGLAALVWLPAPAALGLILSFLPWAALGGLPQLLEFFPIVQGGFYSLASLIKVSAVILFPPAFLLGWLIPSLIASFKGHLGPLYGSEALGSFAGGVLFSLVLEGRASPTLTLAVMPVLSVASLVLLTRRSLLLRAAACLLPPLLIWLAPPWLHQQEQRLWQLLHPGLTLRHTLETPYQQAFIGEYEGQFSLFTDGALSGAWPDPVRAEEKVHSFMTALATPSRILVIGCPTPDLISEFRKYPEAICDIADLDRDLMQFLASGSPTSDRTRFIQADPRQFARTTSHRYDGVLLLTSDPVSLLANRLFTQEAFAEFSRLLNPGGILSFSLTGTENYLGDELEQVLLSAFQTVSRVFPGVFAIPGDPITFWCTGNPADLATSPEFLADRFRGRSIPTVSFSPWSFKNLLLPFRVQELREWLHRPRVAPPNSDARPSAFVQQLRLWNVYSSSGLGGFLASAAHLEFIHLAGFIGLGFGLLLLIGRCLAATARAGVAVQVTACTSGAMGILAELVLVFVYQVRQGALFRMMAFFFGLYMLGLALGAFLAYRSGSPRKPLFLWVKLGQIVALLAGVPALFGPPWLAGMCTGSSIFLIALLAGFELSLLDRFCREQGATPARSAAALLLSDNGGAVLMALISGPILLPALGMTGTLGIAFLALSGNLVLLFFLLPGPDNRQEINERQVSLPA